MIGDSIAYAKRRVGEVMYDAEHFFDGYKSNPAYALACLKAAYDNGARWVVLCDTNGGTLPHEVARIVAEVMRHIPGSHLGIHAHNDTENAVANSLAAIRAGVRQVQGTINGLGERCGNANLVSLVPSLMLKPDFRHLEIGIDGDRLGQLTHVSRLLDELLNRAPNRHAAYVGESAFAHKGGLHVSAVEKDPRTYEHVPPEAVGNTRHIVVSDQSGRSNILARLRDAGLQVDPDDPKVAALVEQVKAREYEGYAYDGAEASFELLAHRALGDVPAFYQLDSFRVEVERRFNAKGQEITVSQAVIKITVDGRPSMQVAEGNGPVDALDSALRKTLTGVYPELDEMRLVDYKVRILTPQEGTRAVTRVMIESADGRGNRWFTVGISPNIIGGHPGGDPSDDRIRRRPGQPLVHRRHLPQHHRRLLPRAVRRHRLQAVPRPRRRLSARGPWPAPTRPSSRSWAARRSCWWSRSWARTSAPRRGPCSTAGSPTCAWCGRARTGRTSGPSRPLPAPTWCWSTPGCLTPPRPRSPTSRICTRRRCGRGTW
jgi:2-isopropylmalate synthase